MADNQIQRTDGPQQVQTWTPAAHSERLLLSLAALESSGEEGRSAAKMALAVRTSELMPKGKPDFAAVKFYPSIDQLRAAHGTQVMLSVLFVLVKDFCSSLNLVRNMTEDQMIEAAQMLLDECEGFRLEDYVMMLTLAKRGQLNVNGGKGLMDRLDLEMMGKIMDSYYSVRRLAGQRIQEEEAKADSLMDSRSATFHPAVAEVMNKWREQAEEDLREQQRREEEQSRKTREEQQARLYQYLINTIASRIAAGEVLRNEQEQTFYTENRDVIDQLAAEIKINRNR